METLAIPSGAVVVGVDGSQHSDHAVDWAARHAANEGRELVVLHAVNGTSNAVAWMAQGGVDPTPYLDQEDEAGQKMLDAAVTRVNAEHAPQRIHQVLTRTDPRTALLEASAQAATLVLGSRGRGPVGSLLLGSVSASVAGHASCPTVVVRPHNAGLVRRGVLVGADGSGTSLPVLEFAFRQASELDLPLTVVHTVWDALAVATEAAEIGPDDVEFERASIALAETVAGFGEKFPEVDVRRRIIRGTPTAGLLALADVMDLVVVGHQRHDPVSRALFGSVALGVLEHASSVVAVVPQP